MDINMPDMDGISATERLSAEVPAAAVVMMSVQGEADYLRRSMLAGAREFLVKPFSSDELTSSIRQVYTRERDKLSRIAGRRPAAGSRRRRWIGAPSPRDPHRPRVRPANPAVWSRCSGPRVASDARRSPSTSPSPPPPSSASDLSRRRLVPVRRHRRPAQPEPEEQVDRGHHPRARARGHRVARRRSSSTTRPASRSCSLLPSPEMAELITPAGAKRMIEALRSNNDLVVVDCMSSVQRHDPCDSRSCGHRAHDALARNHVDQEHPPLPRSGRSARLRRRTRSVSCSIAPIRPWASASPTWSTRSGGASTTRSSPMAGASSMPSTGAFLSSSPTERHRSHRTCCVSPGRGWREAGGPPTSPAARPVRRSRCSHGDDAAARTMADHGRRGVTNVPLEADRKRSTRHGHDARGVQRPCPGAGWRRDDARAPQSRLMSSGTRARVVPGRQVPDPEPRHPGPGPEARPVQPGRGAPPDRRDLRQGHRRGRPRPDARRARPDARADHRRDHRPRAAGAAAARRVDLGSHGQRPAPGLHRAQRPPRAHERRLPERRPRHAHHRSDHRADRPPR